MLEVDIYKDFGSFALDVDFKSDKDVLGLLGASGSGKSLSLKCISGIIKPDSGKIVLNERVLFDSEKKINLKTQDRKIGYLFQDYAIFPNMTVYENIRSAIRKKDKNSDKLIEKRLKEFEIERIKNKKANQISGGEKQRLALTRILVNEPELLLLDEPYSAIDGYLKWSIELEIKKMIEKYQIPTIFVSHDRDEIYRMCKEVVIVSNGISEEKKKIKDLFANPKSLAAAKLSGCKNFSDLEHIKDHLYLAKDWDLELKLNSYGAFQKIGIRSHYIEIFEEKRAKNSFELELVLEIEAPFNYCLLVRQKGKKEYLRIDIAKEKWQELKKKDRLFFEIKEENLMYLKD